MSAKGKLPAKKKTFVRRHSRSSSNRSCDKDEQPSTSQSEPSTCNLSHGAGLSPPTNESLCVSDCSSSSYVTASSSSSSQTADYFTTEESDYNPSVSVTSRSNSRCMLAAVIDASNINMVRAVTSPDMTNASLNSTSAFHEVDQAASSNSRSHTHLHSTLSQSAGDDGTLESPHLSRNSNQRRHPRSDNQRIASSLSSLWRNARSVFSRNRRRQSLANRNDSLGGSSSPDRLIPAVRCLTMGPGLVVPPMNMGPPEDSHIARPRDLEPSIRAHTTVDYQHYLVPELTKITSCCFYWGIMDRYEAEALLDDKPEGTFLLRDSSQDEHIFSVSFRRYGRSLHARIEQWNHMFSFDAHESAAFKASNVTKLLEHYKDPQTCMFFEPMLTRPLNRPKVFSLQHLSRAVVCDHITYDTIDSLAIPKSQQEYLRHYHYKQRIRVRTHSTSRGFNGAST